MKRIALLLIGLFVAACDSHVPQGCFVPPEDGSCDFVSLETLDGHCGEAASFLTSPVFCNEDLAQTPSTCEQLPTTIKCGGKPIFFYCCE